MLESLESISRYRNYLEISSWGDNAMSAGNQQGRPNRCLSSYVSGFVDGEGSFHIAVQRSPTVKWRWQVVPEFHVSQHQSDKELLELIQGTFGCGYIKPNHWTKSGDLTLVYVVKNRRELLDTVIPFFEEFPLITSKKESFHKFAVIVRRLERGDHRTLEGLKDLLRIAFSINRGGSYRKLSLEAIFNDLEPSETIRQTIQGPAGLWVEDIVRSVWRHTEVRWKSHPPVNADVHWLVRSFRSESNRMSVPIFRGRRIFERSCS